MKIPTQEELNKVEIPTGAEYLIPSHKAPENCPMCGSPDTHQEDTDYPDSYNQIQTYSCKCGFTWTELYVFRDWEEKQ